MDQKTAEDHVKALISVTPQMVTISKGIVCARTERSATGQALVDSVLKANEVSLPAKVFLHDPEKAIKDVAAALSWRLAAAEAIWGLVGAGILIPEGSPNPVQPTSVGWTTMRPGGGGESSSWNFEGETLAVPSRLRRSPSTYGATDLFLSEPDLYLHTLACANMHVEVAASFREAVRCFRHDLFTASWAMLGRASEGAWLELGASLLNAAPLEKASMFAKQRTALEEPTTGIQRKVEAVLQIYDRQDIFASISKSTGIRPTELRSVAIWSDTVRDARNTIHFGVIPSVPNTYEKLAALLLGAIPNMTVLYRLKEAADDSAP